MKACWGEGVAGHQLGMAHQRRRDCRWTEGTVCIRGAAIVGLRGIRRPATNRSERRSRGRPGVRAIRRARAKISHDLWRRARNNLYSYIAKLRRLNRLVSRQLLSGFGKWGPEFRRDGKWGGGEFFEGRNRFRVVAAPCELRSTNSLGNNRVKFESDRLCE